MIYKSINRCTDEIQRAFQMARLNYLGLFAWSTPGKYIASKILLPIEQILFFAFIGSQYGNLDLDYYVVGNAIQVVAVSGIFGVSMGVSGERWSGTLGYVFGSPSSKIYLFMVRSIVYLLDGLLGVLIGIVFGIIAFDLNLANTNIPVFIFSIIVVTFSTSAFGLLVGSVSLISINSTFFNNSAYLLLLLLCGVNVPVSRFPLVVQGISYSLPLTRGLEAARMAIDSVDWSLIYPMLIRESLIGFLYLLIGSLLFKFLEKKARQGARFDGM